MLERALRLFRDINLSLPEPLDQLIGGEIDDLDIVRLVEKEFGTVSRTRIRVICATTSFRLSTCWMFSVV